MEIKRMLTAVLVASFVFSSAIDGGVGSFVNAPVAFAAGESDALKQGTYTVPLIRQWSDSDTSPQTTSPLHFCSQGILNVDGNGNQTLTIGVENWSLYEAFIPRTQGYMNEEWRFLPSSLFDEENSNNFTGFSYENYVNVIDTNVNSYKVSTSETKFGDIVIDYETQKDIDVAYITFDLDDYKSSFSFSAWLNTPFYGYNPSSLDQGVTSSNSYKMNDYQWANCSFYLDTFNLVNVDSIYDDSDNNELSYSIIIASSRTTGNKKKRMGTRCYIDYAKTESATSVFDSSVITKQDDGTYIAKYHINSDGYNGQSYSSFKVLKSVTHPIDKNPTTSYDDWDLLLTGEFESLELDSDGYISVSYNSLTEAFIGKYIFFDYGSTTDSYVYYCTPCFTTAPVEELIIKDTKYNTGIFVLTDTSKYPKNTELKIEKNLDVEFTYGDELTSTSKHWTSEIFTNSEWYTIHLVDEDENELNNGDVKICIPLNGRYCEVLEKNILGFDTLVSSENTTQKQNETKNGIWYFDTRLCAAEAVNGITICFMDLLEMSDVHGIHENGIYETDLYFIKRDSEGILSMADSALVKKGYIEVCDDTKKLYFTSGAAVQGAYMGDIFCNNINVDGEVYEDSISYTDFEVVNGEVVSNVGYNAYTEFANVKGGILTLKDECYNAEDNYYSIAVIAPVMQTLTGVATPYEKIKKDDTVAWLKFANLKKRDDMTIKDVEAEYGYKPSALLRKIKQTEIKYNIGKNTASDSTAFTEAYKVYSDPDAKSQDIEAAIKALDAVTTDVAPSAVIKGHDLTVNQWYELSYYVDLGYDVQSDKNAKVVFTLADGRTKTFDVTDDLFVAGQGYRFTLELAAKQMADKIHAKVVFSDGTEKDFSDEYSVKEFLNDYISTGEDENLKAFAQATLNYGAYAQKFFDYNTEDLAAELADFSDVSAEQITDPASSIPKNVGDEIEFAGAALTLEGETSIKLYFELTGEFRDPDDHTIKYNGKKLEMQASNVSDVWYVTIPGIKAKQLGNVFKFTVDGTEYEYSPYTYMNKVLTNWEDTKYPYLHDLLKALYAYSTAANKC